MFLINPYIFAGFPTPVINLAYTINIGDNTSFTRATTATLYDFEDVLKTATVGERRHKGARRVHNRCASSENINGLNWLSAGTQNGDSVSLPVSATACRYYDTSSFGGESIMGAVYIPPAAQWSDPTATLKWNFKGLGGTQTTFTPNTVNSGNGGWVTIPSVYLNNNIALDFRLENASSGVVTCSQRLKFMLESDGGQTNQAPNDYVSRGVGIIDSYTSVTSLTSDAGWTVGTNWSISGGSITASSVASGSEVKYNTLNTKVGSTYEFEFDVTLTSGSLIIYPFLSSPSAISASGTYRYTSVSNQAYLIFRATAAGSSFSISNLTIKEAIHDNNVDGVKYYDTENGNSISSGILVEATGSDISESIQKGLMVEKSATNIMTYSDDLSTSWSLNDITVDTNSVEFVDGALIADKTTDNTNSARHYFTKSTSLTGAGSLCNSIFVKKGTLDYAFIGAYVDGASHRQSAIFNINTGTFEKLTTATGTPTNVLYGIESHNDSWYRIWISMDTTGTGTDYFVCGMSDSANPSELASVPTYTGSGSDYTYFCGAQMEESQYPTSYMSTTSTTVTRNADLILEPTASLIPTNNFTITMDWTPIIDNFTFETSFIYGLYSDANNYLQLTHSGSALILTKKVAGTAYESKVNLVPTAGNTYSIIIRQSSTNGFSVYVDTVKGTTNSNTSNITVPTNAQVGGDGNSANQTAVCVKNYKVYNTVLTDAQIGTTSTLWTPSVLEGVVGGYYASADYAKNISNSVYRWEDSLIGKTNATQTTSSYQPTWDSINGKINFTGGSAGGAGDYLDINPADTTKTIALVYANITGADKVNAVASSSVGANGELFLGGSSGAGANSISFDGAGSYQGRYSVAGGSWSSYAANHSTTSYQSVNFGLFEWQVAQSLEYIGRRYYDGFGYDGDMYFSLLLSGTLSTDDKEKLEGWMAHEFGYTAQLPAGHTYKSTPPYV